MTATRRLAKVEGALQPLEVVLRIISEAKEHGDLPSYARAISQEPVEAAPLSRLAAEVEASVRTASKGRPHEEVESAIRRAVGDAVFRFVLFLRLNSSAVEIADHEGLRAAAAFYVMGSLLGGPRQDKLEPAAWATHATEQAAAWGGWRSVVAGLLVMSLVEEAREQLQARYLGGVDAILSDGAQAWERLADLVDRLWSMSETLLGEAQAELRRHRRSSR